LRFGETVTLRAELVRYDQLFGISSAVIDQDGTGVVVSRDRAWLNDAAVARETRRALTGQEAADVGSIWPWRSAPLVVAAPVGSGGEILGGVVTMAPGGPSGGGAGARARRR